MLTEELQERIDIIRHKLKFIEQKPTVACIEQLEPLVLAGSQMPEWIGIAGGTSVLTALGRSSPEITFQELEQQNPDIMIVMLSGYSVEQGMSAITGLLQLPGFTELKAVKNNRLYIADGNFDNSDPGMVNQVELLAEIINPKQFIFGYQGEGWMKFEV